MSECACDYSYVCDYCQAVYDVERLKDLTKAQNKWAIESIQALAKAAGVELSEPPTDDGGW